MSKFKDGRKRNIIIGDLHGCLDELILLLSKLEYKPCKDRLIFVGDLIGRGPYNKETLYTVKALCEKYNAVSIMGNHEERYLHYYKAMQKKGWQQDDKQFSQIKSSRQKVLNSLSDKDFSWLEQRPYFYQGENFLVVHGGVSDQFHRTSDDLDNEQYKHYLLNLRYLNLNKNVAHSREKSPIKNNSHWSQTYDGRFGLVIYGHTAKEKVQYSSFAVGIDTGCCFGGKLTALVMENDKRPRIEEVSALKIYHSRWHKAA